MATTPELTAHHIGCLTDDINASIEHYRQTGFQKISEIFSISSQQVKVCFIEIRDNFYLELVEFSPDNSALTKIFKTRNPYYHIGYLVKNISASTGILENKGYRFVTKFQSEAFKGKSCAFLYSPEMHLVELIEI